MNKLLLPLLVLSLALAACTATLSHYQLSALNRGMSPQQVAEAVKLPPLAKASVAADGRSFEFQHYRLNDGMGAQAYFMAFEKERLVYWGYASEFRRHPDAALGRALDVALVNFRALGARV